MRTIDARFKVNPEVYKLLPKDKISDMTSNVEEKMYWMKRFVEEDSEVIVNYLLHLSAIGECIDDYRFLIGTQEEDTATILKDYASNIHVREDLWFKNYDYGYVFELNLNNIIDSKLLELMIAVNDVYLIDNNKEIVTSVLDNFIDIEITYNTYKVSSSTVILWAGYVEVDGVGGNIYIINDMNKIFIKIPDSLSTTNLLYKIFPTVWKHIIRYCIKLYSLEGGYISSHVEKRRLEFFVQNLMTLYRVFIEKDLYKSCMNPELPENAVIIYPDFTRR